jgi:hypothetical protein
VADATFVAANLVKFRDALLGHEFANLLLIVRRFRAFRRHAVVENYRNLLRIPDTRFQPCVFKNLFELIDDERGVFVRHC